MVAPSSERAPLTHLPSCVDGRIVGACFDFECGALDNWQLAQWATESDGYVGGTVGLSSDHAARSGRSLRIQAEFQPVGWSAIALELRADVSLADYRTMAAEVLAPLDTTLRLAVRFVIVAGPRWDWLETKEAFPLESGTWSVVEAPLAADAWRGPQYSGAHDDAQWASYLRDVHKIIIRIETRSGPATRHTSGPLIISIDNIWFPERAGR